MVMPFNLEFYTEKQIGKTFDEFSTSWDKVIKNEERYTYSVKEAHDLRIKFQAPDDSKSEIYVDLMDMLPKNSFHEKEDNSFYSSSSIRPMYMNQNSINNPSKTEYPYMLPGKYKMKITVENVKYYALLNVKSLRVSEEQMLVMRDEVEEVVKGLSKQLYKKDMKIDTKNQYINGVDIYYKYDLFAKFANVILLNLNEIVYNPYYEIRKKYSLQYSNKNVKTDMETIKYKQRRRDVTHKIKGYKHELNYDVNINKELLFIIRKIKDEIKQVVIFAEGVLERLNEELKERNKFNRQIEEVVNEIDDKSIVLKKIKQIRSTLNIILTTEWVQSVQQIHSLGSSTHLLKRPSYRVFFKLFKELTNSSKTNNALMQNYLYYWKETPLLYEIWGFIKMLEVINSSKYNFNQLSGWIFDETNQYKTLPFLDKGTKINIQNDDNLSFNLYYDSFILSKSSETTPENPLFTSYKHNRPDFRLDVYNKGLYKGSLIADFKYRAMTSMGSESEFRYYNTRENRSKSKGYKVYNQLKQYSNSETLYLNSMKETIYPERTVKSVWALFPLFDEAPNYSLVKDKKSTVQRISLSPGSSIDHVRNELEKLIDYYINK